LEAERPEFVTEGPEYDRLRARVEFEKREREKQEEEAKKFKTRHKKGVRAPPP
jgi:hypothetical protein